MIETNVEETSKYVFISTVNFELDNNYFCYNAH